MSNFLQRRKIVYTFLLVLPLISASIIILAIFTVWRTPPVLSKESGFYPDGFFLEMDAVKGSKIYYTLDGSIPDEHSLLYDGPLFIENATPQENRYSGRTDVSTGFYKDLIEELNCFDDNPGYMAPDFNVDKCNVVRAVAVNPFGVTSEITSRSYFVGVEASQYSGCGIISMISDPANFFDFTDGIYITGKKFQDSLPILRENNPNGSYWHMWSSNYTQRGKEWEREAIIEVFDSHGDYVFTQACGVRTHGSYSRGALPRGLNLYARPEYDGNSNFRFAFWGKDYFPESLTLTSGGNHTITQYKDYVMTDRVRDLAFSSTEFAPYVLFLDGEYWGFYWLAEKYDAKYLEYHYQVDPDKIVMIKNDSLELGGRSGSALYSDMYGFISSSDMTDPQNYARANELIDMDSYIDYYATMIYIGRTGDWPGDNFALWRTTGKQTGQYSDGRWRWLMFDCNSTSMQESRGITNDHTLNSTLEADPMFHSLWQNDDFRQKFRERILFIADTCFLPADMDENVEIYIQKMKPVLRKSWDRFYGSSNDKEQQFLFLMNDYKTFFENRPEVVKSWFAS